MYHQLRKLPGQYSCKNERMIEKKNAYIMIMQIKGLSCSDSFDLYFFQLLHIYEVLISSYLNFFFKNFSRL